jgi:hypothetical protein
MGGQLVRRLGPVVGLGFLVLVGAGCSGTGTGRYIPSGATARQSLEAALSAWQQGQKPGAIETVSPSVHAVDSRWQSGQKLGSYEILKEESGDGPKWFQVRLKMQKPAGEQVVRYVVVGRGPVWVWREDDYKKQSTEM